MNAGESLTCQVIVALAGSWLVSHLLSCVLGHWSLLHPCPLLCWHLRLNVTAMCHLQPIPCPPLFGPRLGLLCGEMTSLGLKGMREKSIYSWMGLDYAML